MMNGESRSSIETLVSTHSCRLCKDLRAFLLFLRVSVGVGKKITDPELRIPFMRDPKATLFPRGSLLGRSVECAAKAAPSPDRFRPAFHNSHNTRLDLNFCGD